MSAPGPSATSRDVRARSAVRAERTRNSRMPSFFRGSFFNRNLWEDREGNLFDLQGQASPMKAESGAGRQECSDPWPGTPRMRMGGPS
jgi:hypothetical protein